MCRPCSHQRNRHGRTIVLFCLQRAQIHPYPTNYVTLPELPRRPIMDYALWGLPQMLLAMNIPGAIHHPLLLVSTGDSVLLVQPHLVIQLCSPRRAGSILHPGGILWGVIPHFLSAKRASGLWKRCISVPWFYGPYNQHEANVELEERVNHRRPERRIILCKHFHRRLLKH